jgi:N6-adenosine-specific RNA methylase IME4
MLQIKEEFKKLIPALTVEEFNQLEANCLAEGIREKIITWNGFIIDGHNRYEIATKHKLQYETESKEFDSEIDVRIWMRNNQKGRRNLTKAWIIELELGNKDDLKLKAKYTQGTRTDLLSDSDNKFTKQNTRKQIAKNANTSTGMVGMSEVLKAKSPELWEKAKTGNITISTAYDTLKKEEKKIEREEVIKHTKEKIEKEEILKPSGNFSVIAIDPPWDYSEKGGTNNSNYDQDGNRGQVDYPTMTLEQIKNIELPAKEDSVIFLWTVHAFLEDAFELLRNWGFTYKATMVWDKEKMGMGRNIRLQCEFCLLATKGNPIIQGSATRDIMREPRRQHSRKPECFYEMVETITIGNRLDYFSRENRNGWSVYGADLNKFTND